MTNGEENPSGAGGDGEGSAPADKTGLPEGDAVRKDMSYSPASETETRAKQEEPLPDTLDDDIDRDAINVVPGTGGPDDFGDVDVDPEDLNMPGRS